MDPPYNSVDPQLIKYNPVDPSNYNPVDPCKYNPVDPSKYNPVDPVSILFWIQHIIL